MKSNSAERKPKKKRLFEFFAKAFDGYFKTSKLVNDLRNLDKDVDSFDKRWNKINKEAQIAHQKSMDILEQVNQKFKQVNSLPDHSIKRAELINEIDDLLKKHNHP